VTWPESFEPQQNRVTNEACRSRERQGHDKHEREKCLDHDYLADEIGLEYKNRSQKRRRIEYTRNSLALCSRGVPHGPLQFRPSQEVGEARLQQICLGLVVCGAGLPHIGDEDQALLLLVTG